VSASWSRPSRSRIVIAAASPGASGHACTDAIAANGAEHVELDVRMGVALAADERAVHQRGDDALIARTEFSHAIDQDELAQHARSLGW
jgi:hypothetical protein